MVKSVKKDNLTVGIGIVTYNPDIQQIIHNVAEIDNREIVIVDNGSDNQFELKDKLSCYPRVNIILNDNNLGIACALNQIMQYFFEDGIDWVLTLDQDSQFEASEISEFTDASNALDLSNVGIMCPIFYDVRTNKRFDNPKEKYQAYNTSSRFVDVPKCITSGSLTSVKAWNAIGGFDNFLFIDYVDDDYCYRLNKANYRIIQMRNVELPHEIGSNPKYVNFLGKERYLVAYSPFRLYYQTRNFIYLLKKDKGFSEGEKWEKYRPLRDLIRVLFFEKGKIQKTKAILSGLHDGIRLRHHSFEGASNDR